MATLTSNQMRQNVIQTYPGQKWKDKVQKMSENQVIRLFYEFQRKGKIKL